MAQEKGCTFCRVACVVTILLVLGAGGGLGAYFAVKKGADVSSANFENGDAAMSKESGKRVGANANIGNQNIVRENRFYGLSYTPYGLGDNQLCPPFKSEGLQCLLSDQVVADVRTISTMTNRIKTYSLLCEKAMDKLLEYCLKEGIEVMLGVWISKNEAANKSEFGRLDRVLAMYAKSGVIKSVVVGNEAIFVVGVSVDTVAASIKLVKEKLAAAGSTAPVGTAEIFNVWTGTQNIASDTRNVKKSLDMSPILNVVDWIGLNSHAYYGAVDPSTGEAGNYVRNEMVALQRFGKPVYVTETGFPTNGSVRTSDSGKATPSVKNLELFAAQVEAESRSESMPVYFFEPFDSEWKRRWNPANDVDYSWGLHTCDRKLKKIKLPPVGAL